MSVKRTEVSSVRFEINARPASASMEALQNEAVNLNKQIGIVKKNIADLGNVSPEHEGLKSYNQQLDDLNRKLKDVKTTMKDYTRGVKAADELLKAYGERNIESLSMKAIKAGQNGLKKRIENIKPDTANKEDLKAYRIITEVIRESQRVVDTFKADTKETIQILEQGGTVAEATLKKTRDGVRDLMQTTKEGSREYRDYQKQFEFLAEKMKMLETESARVSGQKMLGRAFRGDFATADTKTLNEVIAKLREYQSVINDPNGTGARVFAATEKQIQSLSEQLAKTKGDIVSVEQAMQVVGQAGASVEKMDQSLKFLEDAKRKATDPAEIVKLDEAIITLNQKIKESTGEWMSLADAEKLAQQAGENYYLADNKKGFIASPEEIQKATAALSRQRETLIKTIQAKKANGEATADEERKLQDLTKKLKDLKFEQDNLNMSQEKMRMLMKQPAGAVDLDELRAAIKRADGELKRMEGSLGKNSKEYKAFAEQVKQAKNTLKEMEGAAKANASAWEKATSRLKTYVGLYMGFNMLWQRMVGTASDLLELSDKMGEVRKTTQMTADEVGRLSDSLAKLDTRTSLTGLMEFSSLAGSIGLKTQEDVQGFTEAANMLAVSLPELGSEASRTLMKIADATGDLEKNGNNVRETLERVGSTVIALRANSAAAAGPITDFVSRVGAIGAQAGISIDQIAALGATVDALGGRVEMSATALSRMIPAIKNNSFEVAQAIGMTEKELKRMSSIDQMVTVFKALRDSVKGFDMTTEEGMNAAADAVEDMLGRSTSMQEVMKQLNQQGARAGIVFGLLSQNVDTLEKQLETAGEAYRENTALMDEYNKMNETTAAKWERLKNQIEEFFVSDRIQRILGDVIDMLRKFTDWFASDGPLANGFKMMIAYAIAIKGQFGAVFMGIGGGLKALIAGFGSVVNVLATVATAAVGNLAGMTKGLRGVRMATIGARREWLKMDAAMKSNIIGAIITALGLLAYKLYDMHRASKEAAAEIGRFNQKMADERKALSDLFESLNKSNLAHKDRADLIRQINSQYGKYLGYMLSETTSAIQLADAHALIAKRIREEAYEKRILEQENKIKGEHEEKMSLRYGWIVNQAREGVRGNADATAIADAIKSYIDKNLVNVEDDFYFGSLRRSNESVKKLENGLNNVLERMVVDGKLTRDGAENLQKVAMQYLDVAKATEVDIEKHTSNLRSDLRGVQSAIKVDLANNLNTLIGNVANSVSRAVSNASNPQPGQNVPLMLQGTQGGSVKPPSLFGGNQQGGWQAPWQQPRETTPQQQMAPEGWKSGINKKDIAQVRRVVESQEAIRSYLEASGQQIDEAQRKVAESWKLTDEELAEYRKILAKTDRGPGGRKDNPYGDYNKVTSAYSEWNGNDLVARRKEMLERVKALANGADVQAVLSEDAKFISDAVRKNIKTTEQAIEWYNSERLKIQDALHEKHLTNTGDWLDPKKGGRKASKLVQDEMKYYLDELDAYYTERKAKIQESRNDGEISEAEARNRTLQNEAEWYQRRGNLQKLYSKERKEVTKEEQQAIFDIISERTGDTTDYIKEDIKHTINFIEKVGQEKGKPAMDKILGDIDLGIEKSFLRQRNAIGQHLQAIEDIVNKENPFSAIVENLQKNLGIMDIILADIADEKERTIDKEIERTMFILEQASKGYGLTWEELMREMAKKGWQAWADAINADTDMQTGLMRQIQKVYEAVQDAIRKEASQIKKDAELMWNNILLPGGDGKTTIKDAFEQTTSALGIQEGRVSRANSLIGAGQASERVADRLAIQQMQVQLAMQRYQYNLMHKLGMEKIAWLQKEAEKAEALNNMEKARSLMMQAQNAEMALNLATRKEQTEELKQQEAIIARTEESQARLYKELQEWASLLTGSLQSVFEASNAGNAEYYNERAKLDLTGKGGPGAGAYVVIDNAGTSDATAHYEYLDERASLERHHEIEQQNATADAWKKVMDDINQKMNDMITDQLNAMLQNEAVAENTSALSANTEAILGMTAAMIGGEEGGGGSGLGTGLGQGFNGLPESGAGGEGGEGGGTGMTGLNPQQPEQWMMQNEGLVESSNNATDVITHNAALQAQAQADANKKAQQSTQSAFAKMTQAANLYGIAYQAMSNDNMSAAQKFGMVAVQAAGQAAITALTVNMSQTQSQTTAQTPAVLSRAYAELGPIGGPIAFAIFTGLLGGLMGLAASKIAKGKSEIAQATGVSASAGRLATGMLTYAEGNVNEFTDPQSLTEGRSYNVDAADGKTYRAKYMGKNTRTHITNGPEFHLVGEAGREAIIDAKTTRLMQTDDTGIWKAIQILYNGGHVTGVFSTRRRGRGVRAYAEGNLDDFEDVSGSGMGGGMGDSGMAMEQMLAFQQSLDRNSAIMERLAEEGIEAFVSPYGKRGIVNGYDTYKKEASRHGEKYI